MAFYLFSCCISFYNEPKYKILINGEIPVEIIGNFSIHGELGLVHIPPTPSFSWQGIKISSPEAWYVAYSLLERNDKANLILNYLYKNKPNRNMIYKLKEQPLPPSIDKQLSFLLTLY